jgi:hypothetical protein
MKNKKIPHCRSKKYHTVRARNTTLSEQEIVERGNINYPNTHIHDHSLSWLGTDTPIKCGEVKFVLRA